MSEEHKHEIVIVRRGGHGDHDDHHGGVWKIAFADFMTAMMAFFLVMWLISANDKTRASIAHYFNPVRLVDATTRPSGLNDQKKNDPGLSSKPDKSNDKPAMKANNPATAESVGDGEKPGDGSKADEGPKSGETADAKEKRLDRTMHVNPFVALAEIAGTKGPGDTEPVTKLKSPEPASGRRGGQGYRDPFAPPAPQQVAEADKLVAQLDLAAPPPAKSNSATRDASAKADEAAVKENAKPDITKSDTLKSDLPKLDATKPDTAKSVLASLKAAGSGRDEPKIDVRATPDGLLVSLTDTADTSMFSSGSAVPSRKVVLLVEKIGKILKTVRGKVVVRGFTDNKPYRSGRYDNWHLSLDRAQVTHYMLVRGGLEDARFSHVEGYADRNMKPGVDPGSPLNRRIEILLSKEAS